MASFSSLRAILPAAHSGSGVPSAALKAAATTGASFLVVCPAGARADAVVAAIQAATKGTGLVLSSSRVVACAAKRSGGLEDGRTGEDADEVDDDSDYFIGAGDDCTREEGTKDDSKAIYFGASEEDIEDDTKAFYFGASDTEDDTEAFYFGASDSEGVTKDDTKAFGDGDGTRTGKDFNRNDAVVVFGSGEMTMQELVLMFHKETARNLKQVKHFPVGNDETSLASLMASCDAIGEQLHKSTQLLNSPEGRPIVDRLIALHMRIFSCAGRARIRKRGSRMPDMWSGHRHRLPCKQKRDGTPMEVLLYSMMLANAALGPFTGAVGWDFTAYD